MKYFLLLITLLLINSIVLAYDEKDFLRLKETKSCVACDLTNANLSKMNLKNANLSGANLSFSNLSSTNLSNADLSYSKLVKSKIYIANLQKLILKEQI